MRRVCVCVRVVGVLRWKKQTQIAGKRQEPDEASIIHKTHMESVTATKCCFLLKNTSEGVIRHFTSCLMSIIALQELKTNITYISNIFSYRHIKLLCPSFCSSLQHSSDYHLDQILPDGEPFFVLRAPTQLKFLITFSQSGWFLKIFINVGP